jgi:hypothetical protein
MSKALNQNPIIPLGGVKLEVDDKEQKVVGAAVCLP